jgi:hypothetical protein
MFCHARESGAVTPFCSRHYCQVDGCQKERLAGCHCVDHQCVDVGCDKGRMAGRGRFCEEHGCRHQMCDQHRRGQHFCPTHECGWDGCELEASSEQFCLKHRSVLDTMRCGRIHVHPRARGHGRRCGRHGGDGDDGEFSRDLLYDLVLMLMM